MKKIKIITLLILVALISFLHLYTPAGLMFFHNLYSKLSYFPIVLGAVFFGVRGGIFFAFLTSLGFIPHLLKFSGLSEDIFLSQFTEILLYFSIGIIVGLIAGREEKLKRKYMKTSEELEKSYKRLHEETELLIDIEEHLRKNQKLSALGEISASVAHEIKNPLASIKGVTEIIADEFDSDHPKKEFMDIMENEIQRLDTTVNSMLREFTEKELPLEDEPADLYEVIESTLNVLNEKISEKSVDVSFHKNDSFTVLVGGRRVFQIIFNIVLNAVDAVEKKGVVRITTETDQKRLIISIDDNGSGIDGKNSEKVFEPFFTQKKGGTGLGLSISRKLVESMKGSIRLETSDLGGASFKVNIPYIERREFYG